LRRSKEENGVIFGFPMGSIPMACLRCCSSLSYHRGYAPLLAPRRQAMGMLL